METCSPSPLFVPRDTSPLVSADAFYSIITDREVESAFKKKVEAELIAKGVLSVDGDTEDWIGFAFHCFGFANADLNRVRIASMWYVLFFLMDDADARKGALTPTLKQFFVLLKHETKQEMPPVLYELFELYMARTLQASSAPLSWDMAMWKKYRVDDSFGHLGYILGCFVLGVDMTRYLYEKDNLVVSLLEAGSMVCIYRNEIHSYQKEVNESKNTGYVRNFIQILSKEENLEYQEAVEKTKVLCKLADESLLHLVQRAQVTSVTHTLIAKAVYAVAIGYQVWSPYTKRYK